MYVGDIFWHAVFKYNKGSDSVLVVNKHDYDSCNIKNPIHKMDDGDSTYEFDKVGLFFFISGNLVNCQNGQKLKVAVYSPRHHHGPSLSPAVAPVHSPSPSPSWNSPAQSPTQPLAWNAPSPSAAPARSPTQPPAWNAPSPSAIVWTALARSPVQPPAWNAPASSAAPAQSPRNAHSPDNESISNEDDDDDTF